LRNNGTQTETQFSEIAIQVNPVCENFLKFMQKFRVIFLQAEDIDWKGLSFSEKKHFMSNKRRASSNSTRDE
jgi:hypothetical protein